MAPHGGLRAPLGFSTLACPELSAEGVVALGRDVGANFIEWRGGSQGHVQIGWSRRQRVALRRLVRVSGLTSLVVTAYTNLAADDAAVRDASVTNVAAHIELAADLEAPYVRAFLGPRPDHASDADVVSRAADALARARDLAGAPGVGIAIEPHDEFTTATIPAKVLQTLGSDSFGAVWDVANAFWAGESPRDGFRLLRPWIRYVQLKDWRPSGDDAQLTRLGAGIVPLGAAMDLLVSEDRVPPISIEWERAWHPELGPADEELPVAFEWVRRQLASSTRSEAGELPPGMSS